MNNLNSVLLEGVLKSNPKNTTEGGRPECSFTLISKRYAKALDDTVTEELIPVPVLVRDRLAEVCLEYLHKGRGVRIVGRLYWTVGRRLHLIAEHVEFKPLKAVEIEGDRE